MLKRRWLVLFVGLLAFMLYCETALAQSGMQRARVAFEQGRQAYEAGNFRLALSRFQEAYDITREPDVLYNVASAADRLREDRRALDSYRGYLDARPNTPDRAQVMGRIAVLEERLAAAQREQNERAAERAERERQAQEARDLREQLARRPTTTQVQSDPGPVPWILVAGGGAFVATGIVLVVVAAIDSECVVNPSSCVQGDPMWSDVEERYDRIPILNAVGGVLMGVGAAVMVGGLVWGLTAGGGEASAEVSIGPGALRLRGRF